MSEIEIEKDVALAPALRKRPLTKYPFYEMEVGDSFFVALDGRSKLEITHKLCCAVIHAKKKMNGAKFITRGVKEERGEGVRVWRVA